MTKSEYFANSAKLLLVCSLLLLVSNCLSIFGADGSRMAEMSSKLSDISFYVVFFLSFIAFSIRLTSVGEDKNNSFVFLLLFNQ